MMAFLAVASRPGVTMRELEDQLDLSSAAVSRTIAGLSSRVVKGREGDGLVQQEIDPNDTRYRILTLTPAGHRLAERVRSILYGEADHGAAS